MIRQGKAQEEDKGGDKAKAKGEGQEPEKGGGEKAKVKSRWRKAVATKQRATRPRAPKRATRARPRWRKAAAMRPRVAATRQA